MNDYILHSFSSGNCFNVGYYDFFLVMVKVNVNYYGLFRQAQMTPGSCLVYIQYLYHPSQFYSSTIVFHVH